LVILVLFEFEDDGLEGGHVDQLNIQLLDVEVFAEEGDEFFGVILLLQDLFAQEALLLLCC
jgi:hypothetical protein